MQSGELDDESSLLEWAEAIDLLLQLLPDRRVCFVACLAAELATLPPSLPPRRWRMRIARTACVIGDP